MTNGSSKDTESLHTWCVCCTGCQVMNAVQAQLNKPLAGGNLFINCLKKIADSINSHHHIAMDTTYDAACQIVFAPCVHNTRIDVSRVVIQMHCWCRNGHQGAAKCCGKISFRNFAKYFSIVLRNFAKFFSTVLPFFKNFLCVFGAKLRFLGGAAASDWPATARDRERPT